MKKLERSIWITTVSFLLILLIGVMVFVVFVKPASAENNPSKSFLLKKFERVLNLIEDYYVDEDKIEHEKLVNGGIDGMLEALGDPHTEYLSKEYFDDLQTTSSGKYGGVGMIISEKDGNIIVVTPLEGYPAYKKGIKSGDYIVSVGGVSLEGKTVSEAAELLRGKPGTMIDVKIQRKDISFEVEIKRALIDLPSVKYAMINNKYGYLRITQFTGTTAKHVKEALENFNENNAKGIIVDLRYNGGGLLSEVIEITDFFQNEGVIVSTIGRYEKNVNKAKRKNTIVGKDIPVIVIIDNGSASASEIFAGAIKDTKRGILLGEKSFGKGSVQSIFPFGASGDGFKMTIAKYYTPSGICIDGIGIDPHLEVKEPELNDEEKDHLKRLYDDKIIDKLIEKNSDPTDKEMEKMVDEVLKQGYKLSRRNLKKLVKNAAEIDDDKRPVFDLEFDIQLKKSVELLDKNKIKNRNNKFILTK